MIYKTLGDRHYWQWQWQTSAFYKLTKAVSNDDSESDGQDAVIVGETWCSETEVMLNECESMGKSNETDTEFALSLKKEKAQHLKWT